MLWFLAVVSFLLYANTLKHGFVLDDIAVIEQNSFVKKGLAGIPELFSTLYWQGYWNSNAGLYRPMCYGMAIFLATNIVVLIGITMGDRLLYTPVLGIIIAVVFLLLHLSKNTELKTLYHPSIYFLFVVVLLFSFKTYSRNKVWESNTNLFTEDLLNAPNSARVNFNYATVFFNQLSSDVELQKQQLPFIIDSYKKVLAIDPNDKGALTNLGVCHYKIKDYKSSINYTKQAFVLDQTDYSVLSNLADAYFRNNNFDEAITIYKKLIQNNYILENTYSYYGVTLFNKKEYDKAITIFKEGIKQNSSSAELWMNYGNTLAVSGNLKEAVPAFEKAYELNPNEKNSLKFLAMVYQQLGNVDKANYYYSEFIKK